jgi:hypothetical protein
MNIVVIPEDFRKDQYLLKPLFQRLFADAGKPRARVVVCHRPLLRGVTEALKSDRITEVLNLYPMAHLFILCVDRDGVKGRIHRLKQIETEFERRSRIFGACAWEELETWTLAGLNLPPDWDWSTIRADISVKEHWFERLAKLQNVENGPGEGRKQLGELAARNVGLIRRKCPEDFGVLANRIEALISG